MSNRNRGIKIEKYEAEKREDESGLFQALCVTAVKSVMPQYHFFHT